MRFILPTRIPVVKALLFSAILALVELLEGTLPLYVLLVFLFFMVSTFAFNIAGGFTRPSGAYIFFYSTLTAGVGTVFKALLGQPAHTHLEKPLLTISVYLATTLGLLAAAFLTRKIVMTRDGIAGILKVPNINLRTSALGCFVMVFLIQAAFAIFPGGNGSILHAVAMVNYFLPLGILVGTIAAIRDSGGRRSTSVLTIIAMVYSTYDGMLAFSKQAMFTPFVCWVLGMAWAHFRLRPKHILAIVVFCFIAQEYLTPISNVGRVDVMNGGRQERQVLLEKYIEHPEALRRTNEDRAEAYAGDFWYYGSQRGVLDRLTMLPNDSQLINFTSQGHYFGYYPVLVYFQNWVPHFIDPHKLEGVSVGGNRYAHEMGELAEEDTSTGISYSPSAEAFHLDGWTSVLLLQPCIFLLVFITADAVCGDVRAQPWGLLPMLLFAHIAPEELLNGSINFVWVGNIGTIFCIVVCGYVTPIFGMLLKGRERVPFWHSNLQATAPDLATGAEPA